MASYHSISLKKGLKERETFPCLTGDLICSVVPTSHYSLLNE